MKDCLLVLQTNKNNLTTYCLYRSPNNTLNNDDKLFNSIQT